MRDLRSFRIRFGRAAPPRRIRARGGLLALALLTLLAGGCASLGVGNPCGGAGYGGGSRCGLLKGCKLRLRNPFRRDVMVTDPCGEPGLGIPMDAGPTVIPGAVIPAPGATAPAEEIPALEPAPTGSTATPTTGQTSPNRKTLYETQKPAGGAVTSRRSASAPLATAARPSSGDDPVIELPPLSAPATEDPTPPVAPPAEAVQAPGELAPTPADAQPVSLTEGIARFKVVEPQLAAGSLPRPSGWAFLVEKGYRTVLDLRPRDEAKPGEDAAASHVGLRYVILPMTPQTLDPTGVARFEEEIAQSGNRPLFFFDTDGTRAAALWRLHLMTQGTSEADARAAVAEIGPSNPAWDEALSRYRASRQPRSAAVGPAPAAPVVDAPAAVPPPAPIPAFPVLPARVARIEYEPGAPTADDPTAWRPYAAMLLTGLSVPLAFFGRTALGSVNLRRASLPAPAHQPKSLPRSSGV